MALIKCKECGKEISGQAEMCPNCGCKASNHGVDPRAKSILWMCGIGMILILVGAILLLPALITILVNLGDWYFWNFGGRGGAAVRNLAIGAGMFSSGLYLGISSYQAAVKIQKEREKKESKEKKQHNRIKEVE